MLRLLAQVFFVTTLAAKEVVGTTRYLVLVVPRTELAHSCHRGISRQVRKLVEKEILKPAERAGAWVDDVDVGPEKRGMGLNIPRPRPPEPQQQTQPEEKHKTRKRSSTGMWTCGYCQKVFKSEHYLDLHLERRHMDEAKIAEKRGGFSKLPWLY
eukprot:symbB.v1.2.000282.t1/scaffold23.1/size449444/9